MIPQIQIRQQYGKIGIDSDLGEYRIRQPQAEMRIESKPAQLHITSHKPEMTIDQTRAFEAYNGGKMVPFYQRIYSQINQLWLNQMAQIVEEGNRMAAIHLPGNAFSEIATNRAMEEDPHLDYLGPASFDNVDISFHVQPLDVQVDYGSLQIDVETHKPEIEYYKGKMEIYMRQLPSLEIIPPVIDITV